MPTNAERTPQDWSAHKPLPPPPNTASMPPFDDEPLVSQRPPEQRAFVEAYQKVGSPRVSLFVDNAPTPDEANARSIDYAAVQTIMRDWISSNGQVALISSGPGQQPQQPTDVAIVVRAEPSKQTMSNVAVRIVAEAVNTRDGRMVGSAVVDIPPPLDKPQINTYTRFLARKLMDDMTATWLHGAPMAPPAPAPAASTPRPAPSPIPVPPPVRPAPAGATPPN